MSDKYESIMPLIEAKLEEFTDVERNIAEYFMTTNDKDLSSKNVSKILYVSEAALTRFSKKLGLSGYREFIYKYQQSDKINFNDNIERDLAVFNTYREILLKAYNLYDSENYNKVADFIINSNRIYIYGVGSSGYLAAEFAQRLIRLGIDADSITGTHEILLNAVRLKEGDVVIGISYSGKSTEIIEGLKGASQRGCTTIFFVSNDNNEREKYFDVVLLLAYKQNLEYSNIISPQFPAMIMLDILFKKLYDQRSDSGEIYMDSVNKMLAIVKEKDDVN